jgi:lactoylglutathione lyase
MNRGTRSWRLSLLVTALVGCAARSPARPGPVLPAGDQCVGATQANMDLRLELFVDDVARSVAFYTHALGFAVERASPDYVALCRGGVVLGIGPVTRVASNHYFSPEVSNNRRGLGAEIVLVVDDVAAAEAHARASGASLVAPLTKQRWGQTDFRLADPDGYFLRVTSR